MNYVDILSETDEFRAWEEGSLQGLKDIQRETRFLENYNASISRIINKMVEAQQDLLDEIYGDDDDE